MPTARLAAVGVGFQMNLFVFIERHSRSMKNIVHEAARPSMEIATLAASSLPVKAAE